MVIKKKKKKQPIIALSITKNEYMTVTFAACEVGLTGQDT